MILFLTFLLKLVLATIAYYGIEAFVYYFGKGESQKRTENGMELPQGENK